MFNVLKADGTYEPSQASITAKELVDKDFDFFYREVLPLLSPPQKLSEDLILKIAKEANVSIRGHYDETGSTPAELLRFAKLVLKLNPDLFVED